MDQAQSPDVGIPRLALSPEDAALAAGVSRWRIFDAIRNKEITARKAGPRTLIETAELARWLHTLPTKGREPAPTSAAVGA